MTGTWSWLYILTQCSVACVVIFQLGGPQMIQSSWCIIAQTDAFLSVSVFFLCRSLVYQCQRSIILRTAVNMEPSLDSFLASEMFIIVFN